MSLRRKMDVCRKVQFLQGFVPECVHYINIADIMSLCELGEVGLKEILFAFVESPTIGDHEHQKGAVPLPTPLANLEDAGLNTRPLLIGIPVLQFFGDRGLP